MRSLGSAIDPTWYVGGLSTPKAPEAHSTDEDTDEDRDEDNDSKDRKKNRGKQIVWTRRSRAVDQDDLGSAIDDGPPSRNDENTAGRANYPAKSNRPLASDHVIDLNVPLRTVPYVEPKFYFVPLRPLPTFVITGKNGETFVIDGETTWEKERAKRARNSGDKKSDLGKDGAKQDNGASSREMGEHLGRATYNPSDTNRRRDKSAGKTHGKKGNKETKAGSGKPSDASAPRSRKSSQGPQEPSVLGLASFEEDQGPETPWINASSKAASERSKVVDDPYFQGVGVYNPKSSIRKTIPSKANFETQPIHSGWDSKPAAINEPAPARSTVVLEYVEPPAIQAWLSNPDDYVPPPLDWIAPPDRISFTSPVGPSQKVDQASPSKSNKAPQTASAIRGAAPKALSQTSTVRLENLYSKPASDVHASQKAIPDVAEPRRRKSRKRSRKPTSNPAIPVKTSSHISAKSRISKKPSVTLGSVARTLLGFGSPSWVLQPTPSKASSVLVHDPSRSHITKKSKAVYEDAAPHKVQGSKPVSATRWNAQYRPAKTWTPSSPSHTSTKSKNHPSRSERHNLAPLPEIDTWVSSPKPPLDTWTTSLPSLHPRDSVSQAQYPHSRSSDHEFVRPTHSRPFPAENPPVFTRASKYQSPTVESVHSSREENRMHNARNKTILHAHATHIKPASNRNHDPLRSPPHIRQSPSSPANLSSPHAHKSPTSKAHPTSPNHHHSTRHSRHTHTSPPPEQPTPPVISPVSPARTANSLQNQNPTCWGTLGDGHCNKEIGGTAVSVSEWRLADGTVVVSNARVEGGSGSGSKKKGGGGGSVVW